MLAERSSERLIDQANGEEVYDSDGSVVNESFRKVLSRVKFGDPRMNLARKIPPEAVWGGIFNCFFSL